MLYGQLPFRISSSHACISRDIGYLYVLVYIISVWYTGESNLLKPSKDASIEKRASYTSGQASSAAAGTGFSFETDLMVDTAEKESTELHIPSLLQQKSNDRDALLCDID